jgi:hypothetical protein
METIGMMCDIANRSLKRNNFERKLVMRNYSCTPLVLGLSVVAAAGAGDNANPFI